MFSLRRMLLKEVTLHCFFRNVTLFDCENIVCRGHATAFAYRKSKSVDVTLLPLRVQRCCLAISTERYHIDRKLRQAVPEYTRRGLSTEQKTGLQRTLLREVTLYSSL